MLYDAPNNDAEQEWIELYNPTNSTISIDDWTLSDNVGTESLSGSIDAKDHFVIARNEAGFYALYSFYPDFIESFALSNTGDLLLLKDSNGNAVDFVAWENKVLGWDVVASDTTIRRKNSLDTDTVEDWENSGYKGDPGEGTYPPPDITTITTTTTTTYTTISSTTTTPTTTTVSIIQTNSPIQNTQNTTAQSTNDPTSTLSTSITTNSTTNSGWTIPFLLLVVSIIIILRRSYSILKK